MTAEQKRQEAIAMENKIILIEDDEEIRNMVKDYLSGDFDICSFSNGNAAIQSIKDYDEYSLALHHRILQIRKAYCSFFLLP